MGRVEAHRVHFAAGGGVMGGVDERAAAMAAARLRTFAEAAELSFRLDGGERPEWLAAWLERAAPGASPEPVVRLVGPTEPPAQGRAVVFTRRLAGGQIEVAAVSPQGDYTVLGTHNDAGVARIVAKRFGQGDASVDVRV